MAISNTSILIKRSYNVARPSSLQPGEMAYSYASNTMFIGTPDGTGVINVAGQYYSSMLDAATNANTINTLVKRDPNGSFYGRLYGNANSATTLSTARNFSISGGDITASQQSFDGSNSVILNASLNNITGLTGGTYGSQTAIPVVTVGSNGRITAISTSALSTTFDIQGSIDGKYTFATGNTLFVFGNSGIVTEASSNTITISVDDTILRSNTVLSNQVVESDLTVTGDLFVQGNTYSTSTQQLTISDPLIYLAANNYYSDIVDIGFAANYFDGSNERHTGLVRSSIDKEYYLFHNYLEELSANNHIDPSAASFRLATLRANVAYANIQHSQIVSSTFKDGTISNLNSAILIPDGGTGKTSFTNGQVVVGSGTGALQQLANVSPINTSVASNHTVNNLTTDVYGRVTNYTTQTIGGLTVSQGGTGLSSFTNGQLVVGSGTGALQQLANTNSQGTYGSSSVVPVVTVDEYGRVSSVSNTNIALNATSITSGTLGVSRGGTGQSTFTQYGITYGEGTNGLGVTALAGTSDQTWSNQILSVNNSGVPTWASHMDGGSF